MIAAATLLLVLQPASGSETAMPAGLAASAAARAQPTGDRPPVVHRPVFADTLAQAGAEGLCQALARGRFPAFAAWFDEHRIAVMVGMGVEMDPSKFGGAPIAIPMDLTFGKELDFTLEFPAEVRQSHPAIDLTCRGELTEQRLDSVGFNGDIARPPAGEVWSF